MLEITHLFKFGLLDKLVGKVYFHADDSDIFGPAGGGCVGCGRDTVPIVDTIGGHINVTSATTQ